MLTINKYMLNYLCCFIINNITLFILHIHATQTDYHY